ncbi:serine hydrolase [Flavobacterium sp. j3]|uniref:beta-lactamase n=1 Tax=Flavobacterium aureirubrum TaxID=3133147 RepID=A0ABU9NAD4_9FLAO
MIKRVLIIFVLIISIVIIIISIATSILSPDEMTVLNFIKKNPNRSAIFLQRNDTVFAIQNPYKNMPLASTVKIIIAIEYACQVKNEIINPNEEVDLNDINKYYIKNTDGDSHLKWIKSVSKKVFNNKITIREIAKGMMKYSSNANTEWLIEKLGVNKINSRIKILKLKSHSSIYYFVSALFVANDTYPKLKGKELTSQMKILSKEKYIEISNSIHNKLKVDTTYKKKLVNLRMDIQKVWSDNLPSSTVSDYVSIMEKINSRNYFDAITQKHLEEVMEYILENPKNEERIEHIGMKGGSTAFVLTKALYSTDNKGNKTELAYFFNNLSTFETIELQKSMKEFELKILTNKKFRETIELTLRDN